jgi:hypothetical protein
MASPRETAPVLALQRTGSDNQRLGSPHQPGFNPYDGPKSTWLLSRNAVTKLNGNVVGMLHQIVQSGDAGDGKLQARMLDSIKRVHGLREYLKHLNDMTEAVYVRSVAASKG